MSEQQDPKSGVVTAAAPAPPFDSAEPARELAARRLMPGPEGNPAVDRLAELAARLLGSSAAQVSVLADVQVVAGATGSAAVPGSVSALADSLCSVTMSLGQPLVISDAAADPRVAALTPVSSGVVGAYLGVPLTADDGNCIGALCVYDPHPHVWSEADVTLLQQLAGAVEAELELAALSAEYESERVVWQLAIDAAGVGAFDWDLATGELRWDDRLLELFDLDRTTFGGTIDAFNDLVHPDDLGRVTQALRQAISTCGDYVAEYRVVLPSGRIRWIGARGRAICGEAGTAVRLIGAAYDTTAVQEGEARVARVLETMPSAFFHLDPDWRFSYVNTEGERLLGASREALVGGVIWDLFPAALQSDFETYYRRAVETAQPVSFDAYYPEPLDAWFEVRAWPSPDGLSVYFVDITERRGAQEAIQQAARRSALLAEVTAALTETLEIEQAVSRLSTLVTPELGDWCVITLVEEVPAPDWRRRLRDVGCAHADPELGPLVERYVRLRVSALTDTSFVARALKEGRSTLIADNATEEVAASLAVGEARELLRELAPSSAVVVPLRARGRTVGLLSLYRGGSRARFRSDEVETIVEIAGRAGLALDNTRLFAQQRDLAETLQRSMLTAPPQSDDLEIVVRYVPAEQTAQVGGDWYDSFVQLPGSTVLVIGDVVGHDTESAAAMGQVRSLLRGIAVHTGAGPADVLRGVDQVMQRLQVDTTATAVVARLEQSPAEEAEGVTRLRWSNAGHPPPMLIGPDGAVAVLATEDPDLLLGLHPAARRVESQVVVLRGSTVLLYTDGLVERRGQSLDEGLARLQETLTTLASQHLSLDDLCSRVLEELSLPSREDDVALVAVRLRPQH